MSIYIVRTQQGGHAQINSTVIFTVRQYGEEQVSLNPGHRSPVLWCPRSGRAAGSPEGRGWAPETAAWDLVPQLPLAAGDLIQVCGLGGLSFLSSKAV